MPEPEDRQRLVGGELDEEAGLGLPPRPIPSSTPARSHYALTRREAVRSLANRLIHSRAYIFLYLGLTALSLTTVVLSLVKGCPGLPFYILEIIINSAMIIEVAIRMVALSKLFWKSLFNWVDMAITLFCIVTLLIIASTPCESKGEEVFDTLILVARNFVQFGRLAAIMRKSGTSIFARPKPIDLLQSRAMDIDMDDDGDEVVAEQGFRPIPHNDVLFDMRRDRPAKPPGPAPPEDQEDLWASVG
ncbi:hypothetical protein BS47DRAFT_1377738 [Hydnum rufescens UP504]|uniref:Ion transport domain-containing protein n=1 Tax=Hydnum rufescens UP504 TaxID=1448309 RepID=A0A9P6ALZ9_9AGAM|nr:hypothetical protein BS47DRAFT_1377738 [Hydnum rufescens UP504]